MTFHESHIIQFSRTTFNCVLAYNLFLFSASTRFSFGATTSAATATPGTTGGFSLGVMPATQTGGFSFGAASSGGFNFGTPAATATSTTTPQTGGFAFGSGTSTGIAFGTPSTQPASSGLKLGTTGM